MVSGWKATSFSPGEWSRLGVFASDVRGFAGDRSRAPTSQPGLPRRASVLDARWKIHSVRELRGQFGPGGDLCKNESSNRIGYPALHQTGGTYSAGLLLAR